MTTSLQNLREKMSGLAPRDLIYPGVAFVFFVFVLILFFFSTRFLGKSINSAFLEDMTTDTSSLNIENYTLVAKKLGVNADKKQEVSPSQTETPLVASDIPEVADKSSLSFKILNASGKSGAAGALATKLEAAGYGEATIGNQSKSIAITTIHIKESNFSFGPSILEEVIKTYPKATMATTTDDAEYDVTITIGAK